MSRHFDLQGHRGARGLKPENTLPAFETAFDLGVTTVETDLHMTGDGVPIILHDAVIRSRVCSRVPNSPAPDPATGPAVSGLDLSQMRGYRAANNPDPRRFPHQDPGVTPLAGLFAERHGLDPYTPPTLADLFEFADAYAGELGAIAGKTAAQRTRARQVRFDLELKRVPFRPEVIGDSFNGVGPALFERRVVEVVVAAGMVRRTNVRSFDHRCVRALRQLEPDLTSAVLVADTAPATPALLAAEVGAAVYCPSAEFLDRAQVQQLHTQGIRVVPWTVNSRDDWIRLLDWGVDGITTDFPDRLAELLRAEGIAF